MLVAGIKLSCCPPKTTLGVDFVVVKGIFDSSTVLSECFCGNWVTAVRTSGLRSPPVNDTTCGVEVGTMRF